ncbi:MAG TPA: MutL protein [Firmicutes bacterium]|jgi:uncharacterized protein (TIGR01319 family)|nr:MutL protein [Bacillota bacterium]HOQ23149.1 methylaspartate mutase accessory protein GlmL [Bacillota bacterium]HPT66578.1 methylaspartate mutase accessory protein GlmL [Bacillota bacterium]
MAKVLLIDFGSTYTKVTAVDLDEPRILGTARALTTVDEGIEHGLEQAEVALAKMTGALRYQHKLACSSAAGGLRMVAVGLVPELTVEAARRAALGAGAKVIGAYGFMLTPEDVAEIVRLNPDLLILSGGTDGGDRATIIHNGRALAGSPLRAPVVVAGNRAAAPTVAEELRQKGKTCYLVENVLPEPGKLNIEPVQEAIRRIFLERIIEAKGLDRVLDYIDGVMMPTPASVLAAACRLAEGDGSEQGFGELVVVDVGGATTDFHSVAYGLPRLPEVSLRGLPEPRVKRTVEGDLGMRYSAGSLMEVFGIEALACQTGLSNNEVQAGVELRINNVSMIPASPVEAALDGALGFFAVKGATDRHAGVLETVSTPFGVSYIQTGKDLTAVGNVVGTGGVLAASDRPLSILRGVLFDPGEPMRLKPQNPRFWLDRNYVLTTLGLLAKDWPGPAYRLLRDALQEVKED